MTIKEGKNEYNSGSCLGCVGEILGAAIVIWILCNWGEFISGLDRILHSIF